MAKPPGTDAPSQPRTLRKQSSRIGTAAGNFPADLPYDHAGGAPAGVSGGDYKPNVEGATAMPATTNPNPSPFKSGK